MKKRTAASKGTRDEAEHDRRDEAATVGDETSSPKKYDRPSAMRPDRDRQMRPDFERITSTLLEIDMDEVAQRVRKSLTVGEKRSEHGILHLANDDAHTNAFDGYRLAILADLELRRWELDNQIKTAGLWKEAEEQLALDGVKKGSATNKAIEQKIALLHPEDWLATETKRASYKATVAIVERLAKEAGDRPATLRAMLDNLRGG